MGNDTFVSVGEATHPGATEKLMEYWAHGKGAAKIRWGVPGDFDRCVKHLRKYFPQDPKGLCANLHHRAIGMWPGQEDPGGRGGHHSLEAAELLAAAPLGETWYGPLAPISVMTGDRRQFEPGSLTNRPLPLPLNLQEASAPRHLGAVTVGRIMGMSIGPDVNGQPYMWGWGDWLPESAQPKVALAKELVRGGVAGPSVDVPGAYTASVVDGPDGQPLLSYSSAEVSGATLVAMPAFADLRLTLQSEDDSWDSVDPAEMALGDGVDCGCGGEMVAAVNSSGWRGVTIAPRAAEFKADDAVARIAEWAGLGTKSPDLEKLNKAFMYRDSSEPAEVIQSYRLPIGDIVDGKLVLYYHAIYAAAALISGAHGGLPTVPDGDKTKLRSVISDIYAELSKEYGEEIQAPWDKGGRQDAGVRMGTEGLDVFEVRSGWDSYPVADAGVAWDSGAALGRVSDWAGSDMAKYARAFLWRDPNMDATQKGAYKLPIADIIEGRLTIVPRAVNAVASVLGGGRGGVDIPPADQARIKGVVGMIQKRIHGQGMALLAAGGPLAPPRSWFADPHLTGPTKIKVNGDGRVFGHLATWQQCHMGIGNACVVAPKSKTNYAFFATGEVRTAEGDLVPAGRITVDTGHASPGLGVIPATAHYDNTGTAVAVVTPGEDQHGIWVAGSLIPGVDEYRVAALRRSPLSGDWRRVGGNLELVAALAVNTAGFPIVNMTASGQNCLIAAGILIADGEPVEQTQEDQEARARRLRHLREGTPAQRLMKLQRS